MIGYGFLQAFIQYYCFMETAVYEADVMERVIPTDHIQLMFHYRNPFVVCQEDQPVVKQPQSMICGLTDTFSDVSTHGEAGVVFVSFYPTGACRFFDFPLTEIANRSLDLSAVAGTTIKQTEEQLYLARTIEAKVAVIEQFLMKRYAPIPLYDNRLIHTGIKIINDNKGQINVSELSASLSTPSKIIERSNLPIRMGVSTGNSGPYRAISKCSDRNKCRISPPFFKHHVFTWGVDNVKMAAHGFLG